MKKLLLGLIVIILCYPHPITRASEPNINYYQIRHEIACNNYDSTDARCFWNKVELIHAKEVLNRGDIKDYLTNTELKRINQRLRFLESRFETFCEEAEAPSNFCNALGKLVKKGQYFLNNKQVYSREGMANIQTTVDVVQQ